MNALDERPEQSGLTKVLMVVAALWAFAILAGLFWWAMIAIRDSHLGQGVEMAATAAYTAAVLAGVWVCYRVGRRLSDCVPSQAMDRCQRRQMFAAALYVVLLFTAIWVRPLLKPQTAAAYALAILPALPVLGMVGAVGLYFREETDEFERAVRVEGALWATGGVLALATVWGFAELLAGAPHLQSWALAPVWSVLFSFGVMASRRRYR